ncbi:MAG: hypothetical protein U0441_25535 [Polyangiaceae bacterium]
MRTWILAGAALASSAAMGCGGSETNSGEARELVVTTPEFEVPPGDSFECFYTDVRSPKDLAVTSAIGHQGPGGHHITLYYADEDRPVGHHPCSDAEMLGLHQVTGASLDGEPTLNVPEGLATRIPEGKQIALQSHYINVSGKTEKVTDEIRVALADPSDIVAYANMWVLFDGNFKVPAHSQAVHRSVCTVAKDADLVLLFGHMHEMGKHFTLERIDDQGATLETLYDQDWASSYASHPPELRYTREKPLHFAAGTRLRQTCTWHNAGEEDAQFPREMCLSFGYYFPDDGDRICIAKPDL